MVVREVSQEDEGLLSQDVLLEVLLFPSLVDPNPSSLVAEKSRFLATSKRNKIFAILAAEAGSDGESATVVAFVQCTFASSLAISGLGVCPAERRKGHATALLSYVISQAVEKKISHASLYVSTTSAPAISLYSKFGFATTDTIEGYYSNSTDAHKLELILPT